MVLQWISFGLMISIQVGVAVWCVATISTTLTDHGKEIERLREWRHKLASKEMTYDSYAMELQDHEARIRQVEKHKQ